MSLSSKECTRLALEYRETDYVPCGFYALDYDTVERIIGHETYVRHKARTRIALWEGRRDEVVQSYIEDTIDLYRKLDDVIDILNLYTELYTVLPPRGWRDPDPPRRVDDVTWEYDDGRVLKHSELTSDITLVYDPHQFTRTFDEEQFPLEFEPMPEDETIYEATDAIVAEFGGDKYIVGPYPYATEMVLLGDSMERGMMEMAANPALVERASQSALAEARARQAHWHNRGYDAIMAAEDFAYNDGPFISEKMFRRFCFPNLAANVKFAHSQGLRLFHHACGNNWPLIDSFIEAGIDCYQSIQTSMGLPRLKEYTVGRMSLWGGIPLETLTAGTQEEVRQSVRDAIQIGAPGGGFILGASHSVAVGCPYDNVMAMFDEIAKHR